MLDVVERLNQVVVVKDLLVTVKPHAVARIRSVSALFPRFRRVKIVAEKVAAVEKEQDRGVVVEKVVAEKGVVEKVLVVVERDVVEKVNT